MPGDFTSIVPAVPSPSGVADVFGFKSDGAVQAITSDGAVAWTADASNASAKLPDFQGGLVLLQSTGTAITKVDGTTGQRYPTYTAAPGVSNNLIAVHTDGTVFAVTGGTPQNPTTVVGIDPTTGTEKFRVPLPQWTASQTPALGLIIAGMQSASLVGCSLRRVGASNYEVDSPSCGTWALADAVQKRRALRKAESMASRYVWRLNQIGIQSGFYPKDPKRIHSLYSDQSGTIRVGHYDQLANADSPVLEWAKR